MNKNKAPTRFELVISCLLDRRFNQLSHGATLVKMHEYTDPMQLLSHNVEKKYAQRGARTHDPEIKSLMLYRLS